MANRTVKDANSVHGTNPQYLVEKIIRTRIYDSKYWKEECFALTAELLVDKAMALRFIGGVHGGNIKPSPFLCLTLKLLQIQPERDIIVEFIKQDDSKYLRALGSFYLRLVYPSLDCFKYLEPLLNDYRKLRLMDRNGIFHLTYMDVYIDNLLRDERYCDVILPRIQKRWVHEASGELEARVSLLDDDLDDLESESEEEDEPMPSSPPLNVSPNHRSERSRRSPHPRDKRRRSLSPPDDHKRRRESGRDIRRHRDAGRERDSRRDHHHHHSAYDNEAYYGEHRGEHRRSHHHASSHHHRGDYEYHTTRDNYHRNEDSYRSGRDHHRSRDEGRRSDKKDSSSRKKEHRRRGGEDLQAEIDEANKLRAQLGLPPLK